MAVVQYQWMKTASGLIRLLGIWVFMVGVLQAAECRCALTEEKEVKKAEKEAKCPVDAKEGCEGGYCANHVKDDLWVEFQGRKVFFCCEGCIDTFKKSPDAFAEQTKAQWQVIDSKKEEKK